MIRTAALLVSTVAACRGGSSRPPHRSEVASHDQLLVRTGGHGGALFAFQILDLGTGELHPIYSQLDDRDRLWDATWAGPWVVMALAGEIRVVDPVTDRTWLLDDGSRGTRVEASADGRRVAWECERDPRDGICVGLTDGSEDAEVFVPDRDGWAFPVGWHGHEVLLSDGEVLWAMDHRSGTSRDLAERATGVIVAAGGDACAFPSDDQWTVLATESGATVELLATAGLSSCEFAGPSHLACWLEGAEGPTLTLVAVQDGEAARLASVANTPMIGAPTGDGAAYVVAGAVWLARLGTPPHLVSRPDDVPILDALDWRAVRP